MSSSKAAEIDNIFQRILQLKSEPEELGKLLQELQAWQVAYVVTDRRVQSGNLKECFNDDATCQILTQRVMEENPQATPKDKYSQNTAQEELLRQCLDYKQNSKSSI